MTNIMRLSDLHRLYENSIMCINSVKREI